MAGAFSVLVREDTMFGACYAIGEDFGFNPTYLRAVFALLFFWSPATAAGVYAALLASVLLSRGIVPDPRTVEAEPSAAAANQDELPEELPLAA